MPKDETPQPNPETYGGRVEIAMRQGQFKSSQKLADAVTTWLHNAGLPDEKAIPYQTIQSARTRITKGGISKYTLPIARVCGVNPYWLAFGEKVARMFDGVAPAKPAWPFHFDIKHWNDLPKPAKHKLESRFMEEVLTAAEEPAEDYKRQRVIP